MRRLRGRQTRTYSPQTMAIDEDLTVAVREALQKVLSSTGFSRNERQSRFLQFLVEQQLKGRGSELKESVIAGEVFGRKPDYDPKRDAIVRTEAGRLRARLNGYYATDGRSDRLIIELPKGAYRPVFRPCAGVNGEASPPRDRTVSSSRRRLIAATVVVVTIALIAASSWWWLAKRHPLVRIAVLPLDNIGHGADAGYFADALTDEIISNLSVMEGLTVRSRTSSLTLKGKVPSAREAGTILDVDYFVEGSVQEVGEQLRVNTELVRVRDDVPLWSGRFDREITNVLAVQDDIAQGIVDSLRLKLGTGRRRYEANLEAYDLYQRGRQVMESFPAAGRPIGLPAIQYFEQAIAKDRDYALAYAGLADAALAIDENVINPEMYARAKAAAEKSVALDPMLSEGRSAAASIRAREYAWRDAESGFRRAIELNPNNALAHLRLGFPVLVVQERFEEGLREVRLAVELDPLSPYTNTELAHALFLAGRYDEAATQARRAIALDPSRNRPSIVLARTLYAQGKAAEALTVTLKTPVPGNAVWFACAQVRAGHRDEAVKLLQTILGSPSSFRALSRTLAPLYACLGDKPHAVEYLERGLGRVTPSSHSRACSLRNLDTWRGNRQGRSPQQQTCPCRGSTTPPRDSATAVFWLRADSGRLVERLRSSRRARNSTSRPQCSSRRAA
jgi:TolB-like protein/tetratricopeptide (TPR) repeat protein